MKCKIIIILIFALTLLQSCMLVSPKATPTATSTVAETVLEEVLQKLDHCRLKTGIDALEDTYSFSCYNSADTLYTVSMTHFGSEAAAHVKFEIAQGDNPVSCFHGYNQFETVAQSTEEVRRIVSEEFFWEAGEWTISISARYDYLYFHYNSIDFAEVLYTSGVEHKVFRDGVCPMTNTASPTK